MKGNTSAFTLVEILIVVVILGILAMMVVPKFSDASDDARESQLLTDVQTVRRAIQLYKVQHSGRLPHLNDSGASDPTRIIDRLTKRTTTAGKLSDAGPCGPYLVLWPSNPYISEDKAQTLMWGNQLVSPRTDLTAWYYCTLSGIFWPNSTEGGDSLYPSGGAPPPPPPP